MQKFSVHTLVDKARRTVLALVALNIPMRAAYAGYFIVLSVFPALLLIMSSLRLTGLQVENLLDALRSVVPEALFPTAERLINNTYRNASGAIAGLSAVMALWSSSKGVYGLLTGLNAVYGVSEDRSYFYTTAISVLYALGFLVVLLLTLLLHVFGGQIIDTLRSLHMPVLDFFIDILNLRFLLLMILQSLLFTLMFMVLPNGHNGFMASLPGGFLSAIGWQIFSEVYSVYVTSFSGYANIFGSVYAIALSMLWLYFCLSILFYGGALNRYIMAQGWKKL